MERKSEFSSRKKEARERRRRIDDIKREVSTGVYRIDGRAVAQALLSSEEPQEEADELPGSCHP